MDVKSKWEPGKEPAYPSSRGTTQLHGLSKREFFALTIFSKGDMVMDVAIEAADALILKLNPVPAGAKIVVGQSEERGVCGHDGELIFDRGVFQCMKCKNAVPTEVAMARAKVKTT